MRSGTGSKVIPSETSAPCSWVRRAVFLALGLAAGILVVVVGWFPANAAFVANSMNRVMPPKTMTNHHLVSLVTLSLASLLGGWLAGRRGRSAGLGLVAAFVGGCIVALGSSGIREGMFYSCSIHRWLSLEPMTVLAEFGWRSFEGAFGPWEFGMVAAGSFSGMLGGLLAEGKSGLTRREGADPLSAVSDTQCTSHQGLPERNDDDG